MIYFFQSPKYILHLSHFPHYFLAQILVSSLLDYYASLPVLFLGFSYSLFKIKCLLQDFQVSVPLILTIPLYTLCLQV